MQTKIPFWNLCAKMMTENCRLIQKGQIFINVEFIDGKEYHAANCSNILQKYALYHISMERQMKFGN